MAEVISSVAVVFMDSFVAMQFSRNEITSCRLCKAESNQHHNYLSKIGVKERQQDCGISQLRVEIFSLHELNNYRKYSSKQGTLWREYLEQKFSRVQEVQ